MSNLSNQYISSSYQSVLNIGTISGSSLTGTLQPVTDGFGQQTPISISSTKVGINGDLLMTGSIIPQGSGSFDLGSPTNPFRHGYFSSGSIYLDDHQVLTLVDAATNTALKAPSGGSLQLLNNIVFASDTTDSVGGQFTMQGAGPNNQTQTLYTGSFHFINNDGYMEWLNKIGGSESTGSFSFGLQDGGGFDIENHNGANTIRSVENGVSALIFSKDNNLNSDKLILVGSGPLTIENTTDAQPISIHNNNGSIILDAFKFVSGAFVEANNINMYGDTIVIDANYISSSAAFAGDTSFSGSITLSGTLYPGQIDVSQGNISENTGSYIATFLNNGIMTYDTYQNVATALNPYITGSTINTGSFAVTGSNVFNGNQFISGSSLYMTGSARYNTPGFPQFFMSGKNINGNDDESVVINPYNFRMTRSGSAINGDYESIINSNLIQVYDNINGNYGYLSLGQIEVGGGNPSNSSSGAPIGIVSDFNYAFGDGQDSPALYTYDNNGTPIALIYTQAADGWTDGAMTFTKPANFNDTVSINASTNITGSLTVQGNLINVLGSSPTLNLQLNDSSGSQFPNINLTVDSAATPADIFGGLNLIDTNGSLGMGFVYDSYTTEYFGTSVGQIYAGLPNATGSNTAIIFPSGSASMEVYKPTTFFYPSQNLQGFAQQQLITTQTIGSSSDTVITFNHTDFDPSGWYNSEYFYYQPTVAGTYQVSYGVNFEDAGSGTGQINVQIRQNETGSVNLNQSNLNVGYNQTLIGTYFVQMNGTTDILDLSAYSSVGQNILASNGTFINIKLL